MANRELRQGNSYDDVPIVTLTNEDGSPFDLTNSTVRLTAVDQHGVVVLEHFVTIDITGAVSANNHMTLVGTAISGQVRNSLTAAETLALSGWIRWTMTLEQADGNTNPVASGAWNVTDGVIYRVPSGITRKTLRRRILQELGDLITLTATADGSNQTFIDQRRLIGEPDAYRGQQCLFTSPGLNYAEERYVTGSSRSTRSITFDFALPGATLTGDEAELANFRGIGYRFAEVHRAIETAIENAADTATEPVVMLVDSAFARVPGTVTIPDDWVGITGVQFQNDSDSPWQNLTYSSRILGSGWSVDRANRVIHVGGERGYRIDEKSLQIMGMRRPSPPETDDDLIGVNAEWLTAECVAHLSMAAYRRNPNQERQSVMAMDYQQAGILRSRVLKRSGAGQTVVRL